MAKETINELGMSEHLHKHNSWDTPPICFLQDEEFMDDDDQYEDQYEDQLNEGLIDEENISVDPDEVSSGITELSNVKIIDKEMTNNLNALHSASFKKLENPELPIYHLQLDSSKKQEQKHKHSHFVEVSCGDKAVYIHKTIAVWLLPIVCFELETNNPLPHNLIHQRYQPHLLYILLYVHQFQLVICVFLKQLIRIGKLDVCYNFQTIWKN